MTKLESITKIERFDLSRPGRASTNEYLEISCQRVCSGFTFYLLDLLYLYCAFELNAT